MVREGFSKEMAFEQRPECDKKADNAESLVKRHLGRERAGAKALRPR